MVLRFFVVACALVASAFAQGNLGGFTGTVVDTSKASVAEAKLTFTSYQTNSVHTVVADSDGVYTIRGLTPGAYRLEVEKQGFKKYLQENVAVLTATISTLEVELSVGAVNESVTVTSGAVTLQTTSPEVGTVLERRAILDLP